MADLLDQCLEAVFNGAWKFIGLIINKAGDKITEKVPDAGPGNQHCSAYSFARHLLEDIFGPRTGVQRFALTMHGG